jgi:hypothetical protein
MASGLTEVIGITIAKSGDNIAASTPMFRTMSSSGIAVTIVVFIIIIISASLLAAFSIGLSNFAAAVGIGVAGVDAGTRLRGGASQVKGTIHANDHAQAEPTPKARS